MTIQRLYLFVFIFCAKENIYKYFLTIMDELSLYKQKLNITVRFSDLNALAHISNATFFTFMEEARFAYFGVVLKRDKDILNFAAIIACIEIDYNNQNCLGAKFVVYTHCLRIGE
jgi:acyl-CoA thioesterase FadM